VEKTKRYIFADCETNPFKRGDTYSPYIFGAYCAEYQPKKKRFLKHRTFDTFETVKDFVDFASKRPSVCYFHNGGKFDYFFLLKYIEGEVMFIQNRLARFGIGECEFRDSYNIIPIGLAKYKKDDFDYSLLNDYKANKEQVIKYLRNDCVYLSEMVIHFVENYGTKLTIASSALNIWAKMCGYHKSLYKTSSFDYDRLFREYYFGGRVECAKLGDIKADLKCYDINSSYPFAMMHKHPWGYVFHDGKNQKIQGKSFVKLVCVSRGALCRRNERGETVFDNDGVKREYKTTGWEYIAGVELGLLEDVEILWVMTHTDEIDFCAYVDRFYEQKKNSVNGSLEYISAKLFQNSLYGKFGQDFTAFEEFFVSSECKKYLSVDGKEERKRFEFSQQISTEKYLYARDADEGEFFNVAIAASITGFARAYLLRAIKNSRGFVYCDTDSVFCESLECLKSDTELGAWKCEGEFDRMIICGKKLYCAFPKNPKVKHKIACKGVKLTSKDFEKMACGETVIYDRETPSINMKRGEISYLTRAVKMEGVEAVKNKSLKNIKIGVDVAQGNW